MKEEKRTTQFANIFIGFFVLIIIGYFLYGFFISRKPAISTFDVSGKAVSPTPTIILTDYVSYPGKTGKTALELLKEKASIEQVTSGLINGINGRKADASQHEYWAFYINGKLAQVGPVEYQTKDGDMIEWKIEKY